MNDTYLSITYDTRRDAGDVGTKKSIKTAIFKAENDVCYGPQKLDNKITK